MKVIGFILLPITFLYSLAIRLRNHLFDIGYTRTIDYSPKVISVGNLIAGGAGKTPMVEYLVRLLSDERVSVLSRGYGRSTKGIRIAGNSDSASTIGDEPYQIYRKYGDEVMVAVGEERVLAIPTILHENEDINVIVLDDAYQHRYVKRDLNILLTTYSKPFYSDFLLPSGRLREPRKEADRADVIIVTKCPESLKEEELSDITASVSQYSRESIPVYFTRVNYSQAVASKNGLLNTGDRVFGFAGIANPAEFESYLAEKYTLVGFQAFRDHQKLSEADIENLIRQATSQDSVLVTTEKDYSRVCDLLGENEIFYIPIECQFLKDGKQFDSLVFDAVASMDNP